MTSQTRKTTRKRRKKVNYVAPAATITLTSKEALAILGGVNAALEVRDPPDDVAPHLSSAIDKFIVAFGFEAPPAKEGE